ncbi:MAG TPA: TauD/TfdA family dioxygenase [Burkholderiales bacterium]|nr:TauD/TfdA family dioxygenase [Burkholderiales bacterium]
MEIRKLSNALGAEVTGIDLRELDDRAFERILSAWHEHLLLVFRDQHLDYADYIRFGSRFGQLETYLHGNREYTHPDHPEIYFLTNHEVSGKASETRDVGREWHTDQSYTARPLKATMLYCREIPEHGGDTMFSNMYLAFERLSPKLQSVLEGLEAVHDFTKRLGNLATYLDPEKIVARRKKSPPVAHPVVRVHPETGRKSLYVSEAVTTHFVGMTRDESAGLLQHLFQHSTHPELTHRHRWRVNDVAIWDNRCTLHYALKDFDHASPRHMVRMAVLGTPLGRVLTDAAAA